MRIVIYARVSAEDPLVSSLIKGLCRFLAAANQVIQIVLTAIRKREDIILIEEENGREQQRSQQSRGRQPVYRLSRRFQRYYLAGLFQEPERYHHGDKRGRRRHIVDDHRKQEDQIIDYDRPLNVIARDLIQQLKQRYHDEKRRKSREYINEISPEIRQHDVIDQLGGRKPSRRAPRA